MFNLGEIFLVIHVVNYGRIALALNNHTLSMYIIPDVLPTFLAESLTFITFSRISENYHLTFLWSYCLYVLIFCWRNEITPNECYTTHFQLIFREIILLTWYHTTYKLTVLYIHLFSDKGTTSGVICHSFPTILVCLMQIILQMSSVDWMTCMCSSFVACITSTPILSRATCSVPLAFAKD